MLEPLHRALPNVREFGLRNHRRDGNGEMRLQGAAVQFAGTLKQSRSGYALLRQHGVGLNAGGRARQTRWGRANQNASRSDTVIGDPAEEVQPDRNADEDVLLSINEQIETLDGIISSLRGRTDSIATVLLQSSRCQLRDLRIQATRTKPLEDQVRTLAELVERKSAQLQIASAALAKATEHHRWVAQALANAQQE